MKLMIQEMIIRILVHNHDCIGDEYQIDCLKNSVYSHRQDGARTEDLVEYLYTQGFAGGNPNVPSTAVSAGLC